MVDREADTVVILSSELISKITEEYFNKTMFKQKVEIVDLKPTDSGYMFSVVFVSVMKKAEVTPIVYDVYGTAASGSPVLLEKGGAVRGRNGQFTKVRR
jgi:hypothetical protein